MRYMILWVAFWAALFAQSIVTPAWVAAQKDLHIVEITPDDGNAPLHIQGATATSLDAWRTPIEKHFLLKDAKSIQNHMRSLGIHNDTHVVLYAHIKTPKEFLKASYIYWAMKHYGLKEVYVLDGGFQAWEAANLPTQKSPSTYPKGTFTAKASTTDSADMAHVKSALGTVAMIDARPSENYFGSDASSGVARLGHITGAMSYFWKQSVQANYTLKPKETLQAMLASLVPHKEEEVIVYCTGGLETSFNYLVLEGVLGYKNVKLYDASMREWGNQPHTPMRAYVWEMFTPTAP